MTDNSALIALIEGVTDTLIESAADSFTKWMASSDAPESVKQEFTAATEKLTKKELGIITLATSNWVREVKGL